MLLAARFKLFLLESEFSLTNILGSAMSDEEEPQEIDVNLVDCDLLEAAKENIQPLATGRRVTALSAILSTPHAQREAKLSATRNRLRINVELALEDEESDLLEAYCQLVYWTVENYPQGHTAESGLLELLEEATRSLKDDRNGKWRGDIKYLKLWLLYASYVEKPTIIYNFMIANDIGTDFSLFYEEHAAVLERGGRLVSVYQFPEFI
jgi:Mad3/BUB1 homology region 1